MTSIAVPSFETNGIGVLNTEIQSTSRWQAPPFRDGNLMAFSTLDAGIPIKVWWYLDGKHIHFVIRA